METTQQPIEAELPVTLETSPDRPHWGALAGIAVWIGSIALLVITQGLAISGYAIFSGREFADNAAFAEFARTDPTAIIVQGASTRALRVGHHRIFSKAFLEYDRLELRRR